MNTTARGARGFTLLELMVSMVVLLLVVGSIFAGLRQLQMSGAAEENKLDITQTSREFMDQIIRDLHQAGFPSSKMYTKSIYPSATNMGTHAGTAVGLVYFSPTEIRFEGDMDSNGSVESIRYRINSGPGGTCPCTIERSQKPKIAASPVSGQSAPEWNVALDNVINSGGAYTIAGTTTVQIAGGGSSSVSNDTLYTTYKAAPVFQAFDRFGTDISGTYSIPDPWPGTGGSPTIYLVRTIKVNVNMLSRHADKQTGMRQVITMTSSARINNPSSPI